MDKIFAYIEHKNDLNNEIVNKYINSLIFIGDEQQIYQPLTNTYVGIGKSEFDRILSASSISQVIQTDENTNLFINFSYNNSFGFTYVDQNLIYNPYYNSLRTSYFIGDLNGNAYSANRLSYDTTYSIWGQTFFENGRPENVSGDMSISGYITNTKSITPLETNTYTLGSEILEYSYTYSRAFIGRLFGTSNFSIGSATSNISNISFTSKINTINDNIDLFLVFAYNNNYSYSYVDSNLKYNPYTNTLSANYLFGILEPSLQWGTIEGED